MKATIESTSKQVTLIVNGAEVPARVWEGKTDSGIRCHFYVTRVSVPFDRPHPDYQEFERELKECKPPAPDVAAIPLRLIL